MNYLCKLYLQTIESMNYLWLNLIFFWEISQKKFQYSVFDQVPWQSLFGLLEFFLLRVFFSRSAFWCLIFPFLMLSSATFKLDFWLLNSNSSSSIFYFWVCNTSCSFFFIYCSSFSLDWISFCISRSATYLLWTIFTEEISSREIGKFVTHTTQQTSSSS